MSLKLSQIAAVTAGLLIAAPTLAKDKADAGLDVRRDAVAALACTPVKPIGRTMKIDDTKLPKLADKSGDRSFLDAYPVFDPKTYRGGDITRGTVQLMYGVSIDGSSLLEPILAQLKQKFGNHPNWSRYEALVRKDAAFFEEYRDKARSGQVLKADLDRVAELTAFDGRAGVFVGVFAGEHAKNCFGFDAVNVRSNWGEEGLYIR